MTHTREASVPFAARGADRGRRRWLVWMVVLCCLSLSFRTWGQAVQFSHGSGFYDTSFVLRLAATGTSHPEAYTLRFTLNGSTPTADSRSYSESLVLSDSCFSRSQIFRIQNGPDEYWYSPTEVEHIVVVRAALFDSADVRRSSVATRAFVVAPLLQHAVSLPVVALCADSASLFDYRTGIFVRGASYDPLHSCCTGNYYKKGRDWERDVCFVYLDGDQSLTVDCGLRIHGNSSRRFAQKGLSLYARKEYGSKYFEYPFWGTDASHLQRVKRLVLRPFRSSWMYDGVEDWICQQLASSLRCDHLSTRPVVLFLNGEYWGVYYLEEKPDERYVEDHYGVDADDCDLMEDWDGHAQNGSADGFMQFLSEVDQSDLSDSNAYARIRDQIDLPSFIDYVAFQLLTSNRDWPANNMRCWSANGSPWRWIFFDGDGCLYPSVFDPLANATSTDSTQTWPASVRSTLLLRRLLENDDFRAQLGRRMKELVLTVFDYSRTQPLFRQAVDDIRGEMASQMARFANPVDRAHWDAACNDVDRYLRHEPSRILDLLFERYTIPSDLVSDLQCYPNPAHDEAYVAMRSAEGGSIPVEVFDVNGRLVYKETFAAFRGDNIFPLPVERFGSGLYLVRVAGYGMLKLVVR